MLVASLLVIIVVLCLLVIEESRRSRNALKTAKKLKDELEARKKLDKIL